MNVTKTLYHFPVTMILLLSLFFPIVLPHQAAASQREYEETMKNNIDKIYREMARKIDGLDPIVSNFSNELITLERYALQYVELYQPRISLKNTLHELGLRHVEKRQIRLNSVNAIIKDVTDVHVKYGDLFRKLQSKRDKLIILHAGKLVFDYVLLPLDRWNFIADRIVNWYSDKAGPVKFVPEGGLGATTATRRLGQISKELDTEHKKLHSFLYTEPKNTGDYFRIVHAAEIQAKKCWNLSYEIQYSLREDRNNSLAIAENRIKNELERVTEEVDRILGITTTVAQCVINPGVITLDRSNPREQVTMSYLHRSGLNVPAEPGDFHYETDNPEIASVDDKGAVTGKQSGTTRMTAVNKKNNLRCSITVTVNFQPMTGKQVRVPDVIGMDYPTAQKAMKKAGLSMMVSMAPKMNILYLPDTVTIQSPKEFSLVNSGSTVFVTMNPPQTPQAQLLAIVLEGDPPPPFLVNTTYTLAAVVSNINPNNTYTFNWYINGIKSGKGQSLKHTFKTAGTRHIKVMMSSTDPRENSEFSLDIAIEYPRDVTVDFTISPIPAKGDFLRVGEIITFTQTCKNLFNHPEYRWYINGSYFQSGPRMRYQFQKKGVHDITLGIRAGSNFDEVEHTRSITVGEKNIGVLGTERNRFKALGKLENLTICSEYWVGGTGRWSSKCTKVATIGPVDGFALCTGEQSDGYNTGFLVYSKKGSGKLSFKVFHFSFNQWKGTLHYSGDIPSPGEPDPETITLSCRANVATITWGNKDGTVCSAKLWKFKYSKMLTHSGLERPVCSDPVKDPDKLNRCTLFADKAVAQYRENISRNCDLKGPEWHGNKKRHQQWCMTVSAQTANELTTFRADALERCGKEWRDVYAKRAVEQNEENLRNNCGFSGSAWQSDYSRHYNWSATVSRKQADAETRKRDVALKNCLAHREDACRIYAETAVKQNQDNLQKECGFCGQRWQSSFDAHYQWCLQETQKIRDIETSTRKTLLSQCKPLSANGTKTFYAPCFNGYRLDNCLNFGTNCEKPAADSFCSGKGFTQAISWELEKARPTYIMGDGRLCDGDFCAGFKYITCSGYKNFSNQAPVCNIQRPVSGKTIQVGTTIGFSAKATDPDKDKLNYSWTFEGGTPDKWDSWQGMVYAVRWSAPGTYTATLTVTDTKGSTCSDTVVIAVLGKDGTLDCDQYADKSIQQNQENLNRQCGYTGELWHSDRERHLKWCRTSDQRQMADNIQTREKALNQCQATSETGDFTCEIASPPTISFIDAGKTVNFASTCSNAAGPLSYQWTFGEYGTIPATSSQQNPGDVTFQWAGNYNVLLTVTDSRGNAYQSSRHVLVYDPNDPREFCEGYAGISIELNEKNIQNNCGFSGGHWHSEELTHQKWCQSVSLDQARASLLEREEQLRQCLAKTQKITGSQETINEKETGDNAADTHTDKSDTQSVTDIETMSLSCENKENQEKGCCCFQGAHTYRFEPRHVTTVLAEFDTGKRFNCQSTVKLEITRDDDTWETVKSIQANSSRNGSEVAPMDAQVLVNAMISGFRISDGCRCCIDWSRITLNAGVPQGNSSDNTSEGDVSDDKFDTDNPPPDPAISKAYQQYIAAYNALTSLMAAGKGDTPQAQEAYKKYKDAKDLYETALNTSKPNKP
ncbi:PKD domain-containing protein [Desulfocicer niacini]